MLGAGVCACEGRSVGESVSGPRGAGGFGSRATPWGKDGWGGRDPLSWGMQASGGPCFAAAGEGHVPGGRRAWSGLSGAGRQVPEAGSQWQPLLKASGADDRNAALFR